MTTLLSVNQFSQRHPAFTPAGLRWFIFKANENGLDASGAIVRLGRRKLLIDEAKFVEWVRSKSTATAA